MLKRGELSPSFYITQDLYLPIVWLNAIVLRKEKGGPRYE